MDPTTTNDTIASAFFDADISVEEIIWIAGCSAHPSSRLKDLAEEDAERLLEALGIDASEIDLEYPESDEILQAITASNKQGFLVQVSTPALEFHNPADPESSATSSWGYVSTNWMYTERLDAFFAEAAMKWKQEISERQRLHQLRKATTHKA